ncbi:Multi antimicrobial extrusion protein [Sesbania bispinosa]|nr:Multi antimicrobial extrusion protein [Sesbania bispinosa]
MSQSSSTSSTFCETNEDHPNIFTTKVQEEPNMFTTLIPKSPTCHQQNHNTHLSLALIEAKCIANISFSMVLTGLLLYSRSMISMLFLGHLGELALAGGSLAIGFANITGYSVLSGLAMGMEPLCGQAFGAKRFKLLGLAMQRMVLLLLLISIFISFLWLNMKKILLLCHQEEDIANEAQFYILYSLPDLIAQSLVHPLRIYLRSQSITLPLTCCAALSILLHVPINYLLVTVLKLGIKGIALSAVWTNFNLVASLIIYIKVSGNPMRAKVAAFVGLCFSFVLGFSALFFAFSVRNVWASMFTQDAKIIALTSMVLPIVGLCELGNCPQTTVCGVLRGTARPKLGANINLGCFYLVGMPIAVWLSFFEGFDFKGLWLGMLAAQGSCMVTMMFVLARTNWDSQAQRAKELTSSDPCEEGKQEVEEEEEEQNEKSYLVSCAAEDCGSDLLV